MRNSPGSNHVAAFTVAFAVLVGAATDAHRSDEYLQAARLSVAPDRVQIELDLTPGVAVANRVLSEIDPDGNGTIDTGEIRAYSQRVLSDITLEMDGRPVSLDVIDSRVPTVDSLRLGESAIHLRMAATIADLGAGSHRLHYRNTHRSDIGAYLANALVPASDRVIVTSQQRDRDQRDLIIECALRPARVTHPRPWLVEGAAGVLVALGAGWWRRSRVAR